VVRWKENKCRDGKGNKNKCGDGKGKKSQRKEKSVPPSIEIFVKKILGKITC
jgi:hypothetical protein